jgi:general stress protein 26
MTEDVRNEILALRKNSAAAYVGSVDREGFPQIKCMLVLEHDSARVQWFSTNLSSKRAQQFLKNPKASVYYCDEAQFKGALFIGLMEVCTGHDAKASLWRDGFEMYYPKGLDDEDYCVLRFTADIVNYYHGLKNETFPIEEI